MPGKVIGIGVERDPERVFNSISRYPDSDSIICYTDPCTAQANQFSWKTVIDENPGRRLISDLIKKELDAAVRGSLPAHETLSELKKASGISELQRIVLLESASGKQFFLAPVGIDEGWTISQKMSFIQSGQKIATAFGLSSNVGIISGGRLGDIGRHPQVDRTLGDAELLSKISGAKHYEILIEDAIQECGLIIAPDGISGNLIFRTLIFLGNGAAHGAPVVNIRPIFVDTSRVNPDYSNALILASRMIRYE